MLACGQASKQAWPNSSHCKHRGHCRSRMRRAAPSARQTDTPAGPSAEHSAHAQCAPPSASGEGVMAAWWSRSTRLKVPFGSPSQSPISLLSTPTSARLQLHRSSALQYMQSLARPLGRMGGPEKPCKPGVREGPRGNWLIEVMSSDYRRKRVAKVKSWLTFCRFREACSF